MIAAAERLARRGASGGSGCSSWSARRTAPTAPGRRPTSGRAAGFSSTASRPRTGSRSGRRARFGWTSTRPGRAAHSAYPDEGVERHRGAAGHPRADPPDAAAVAIRCWARPRSTSVCIEGGVAPNVHSAETRRAQLLFRTVEPTGRAQGAIAGSCGTRRQRRVSGRAPVPQGGGAPAGLGHDRRELRQRPARSSAPGAKATSWARARSGSPTPPRSTSARPTCCAGVDLYVRLATDLLAREAP